MSLDDIQVGSWYQTTLGIGQCLDVLFVEGNRPRLKFLVIIPNNRGIEWLGPSDVRKKVASPLHNEKEAL